MKRPAIFFLLLQSLFLIFLNPALARETISIAGLGVYPLQILIPLVGLGLAVALNLVDGVIRVMVFVGYILGISMMKDIRLKWTGRK